MKSKMISYIAIVPSKLTTNGLYLDDLQANHLNPTRSQHTKPVTGNQHRKKKLPLLLTSFAIHCLTKTSAFVPQCKTDDVTYMKPSDGNQTMIPPYRPYNRLCPSLLNLKEFL